MTNFHGFVPPLSRHRKLLLLRLFSLCITLSLAPWPVNAVEVYQWTDENGVVHFSQWAPTEPEKDVSTLEVDGNPPDSYDPQADLYNVEANKKYMESLWADREKRREESRKRQAAAAPQIIQQTITPEYGAWPVYPAYGLRPPLRPDRPDRPEKPVRPQQPIEPPGAWVPKRRDG